VLAVSVSGQSSDKRWRKDGRYFIDHVSVSIEGAVTDFGQYFVLL